LIKVGYTKTDGTDVLHETVQGAVNADVSIRALQESKEGDSEVDCFYLEMQITDTVWEKYASVDPL
tara:strand:- start:1474 stop:1671 length:198 start_codon:yes stop_codon:yes gene_type:complete